MVRLVRRRVQKTFTLLFHPYVSELTITVVSDGDTQQDAARQNPNGIGERMVGRHFSSNRSNIDCYCCRDFYRTAYRLVRDSVGLAVFRNDRASFFRSGEVRPVIAIYRLFVVATPK
jgi:hypothetical protein